MDSLEKKESPESAGPEITKKMVRERTTKKIVYKAFLIFSIYFINNPSLRTRLPGLAGLNYVRNFSSITEAVLLTMIDLNSKNISEH